MSFEFGEEVVGVNLTDYSIEELRFVQKTVLTATSVPGEVRDTPKARSLIEKCKKSNLLVIDIVKHMQRHATVSARPVGPFGIVSKLLERGFKVSFLTPDKFDQETQLMIEQDERKVRAALRMGYVVGDVPLEEHKPVKPFLANSIAALSSVIKVVEDKPTVIRPQEADLVQAGVPMASEQMIGIAAEQVASYCKDTKGLKGVALADHLYLTTARIEGKEHHVAGFIGSCALPEELKSKMPKGTLAEFKPTEKIENYKVQTSLLKTTMFSQKPTEDGAFKAVRNAQVVNANSFGELNQGFMDAAFVVPSQHKLNKIESLAGMMISPKTYQVVTADQQVARIFVRRVSEIPCLESEKASVRMIGMETHVKMGIVGAKYLGDCAKTCVIDPTEPPIPSLAKTSSIPEVASVVTRDLLARYALYKGQGCDAFVCLAPFLVRTEGDLDVVRKTDPKKFASLSEDLKVAVPAELGLWVEPDKGIVVVAFGNWREYINLRVCPRDKMYLGIVIACACRSQWLWRRGNGTQLLRKNNVPHVKYLWSVGLPKLKVRAYADYKAMIAEGIDVELDFETADFVVSGSGAEVAGDSVKKKPESLSSPGTIQRDADESGEEDDDDFSPGEFEIKM